MHDIAVDIDLDDGTCSVDLAVSVAPYFGLDIAGARRIIKEVARWRSGEASPRR